MNKKFIAIIALVFAVVLTGYSVSGTYAKYTTEFTGTAGSARVAKWDVKLKAGSDGEASDTETFKFDLFKTATNSSLRDGVHTEASPVIAPGSTGSFEIEIDTSASEVKAEYTVNFELSNGQNIPLQFKVDGTDDDWQSTISNIGSESAIKIDDTSKKATVKVDWQWPFEREQEDKAANNKQDTALGKGENNTVSVTATVTVSQQSL